MHTVSVSSAEPNTWEAPWKEEARATEGPEASDSALKIVLTRQAVLLLLTITWEASAHSSARPTGEVKLIAASGARFHSIIEASVQFNVCGTYCAIGPR